MISVFDKLISLINGKLENYIVSTNDSKFNDVKQIIGNDNYTDGKPYLITNDPINDQNFIQHGTRHTILGMQYAEQKYGQQISFSLDGVKYRSQFNGTWKDWQCLTQNIKTGTEFETGRIIDGKKEYGKRINFGKVSVTTNNTRVVSTGLTNVSFTKPMEGMITNGTYWFPINGIRPKDGTDDVCIGAYMSGTDIVLLSKEARNDYTGYVTIFYTKN